MNLEELKQSMSTLDDVLAQKSDEPIRLNTSNCDTAQKRIMKKYRQGALSTLILAIVFPLAWNSGFGNDVFTTGIKIFFESFLVVATLWYAYLYFKTKDINILVSSPMDTMKKVATLRLYALSGEIVLGMAMAIFFTLFLTNLWDIAHYRFWIVAAGLAICLVLAVVVFLPKNIRDFKNLTSIE